MTINQNTRVPLFVAGAALLALTGCNSGPAAPAPAATAAAPTSAAPASVAPSTVAPSSTAPVKASPRSGDDGCPAKPAALQKAAKDLRDWKIDAASIKCSQGWATAAFTAPTPAQQGDGVVVFAYDAGTRTWTDKGQGSAIECAAFGIPAEVGRTSSVCYNED